MGSTADLIPESHRGSSLQHSLASCPFFVASGDKQLDHTDLHKRGEGWSRLLSNKENKNDYFLPPLERTVNCRNVPEIRVYDPRVMESFRKP